MSKMSDLQRSIVEKELASVWPQWHITRILGHGSFGDVYEIRRDEFGVPHYCALKTLRMDESVVRLLKKTHHSDNNVSEAFLKSASTEINIMEALKGAPNIVIIEDYALLQDEDDLSILIRMELLKSLHADGKIFSENDVIKIGIDICNALEFCHRKNIIHRDIKESNIFYSDHGEYKLGDFGVSRHIESLHTQAGLTGVGTISSMAPEVYMGREYDHTTDIYSLGIVLYTLLNHDRAPYSPSYPQQIGPSELQQANLTRIYSTYRPPLPDQAQNALGQIICKACDPTPANRYQSAYEFRCALLAYQNRYQQGTAQTQPSAGGINENRFPALQAQPNPAGVVGQVSSGKPNRQKNAKGQKKGHTGTIVIGVALIALIAILVGTGLYINSLYEAKQKEPYDRYIAKAAEETDFQEKIVDYQSAIALDPGNPEAYMNMMEDIEKLDEISTKDSYTIYNCLYNMDGDPDRQKFHVDILKEENPGVYADFTFRLGTLLWFSCWSERDSAKSFLNEAVDSGALEDRKLEKAVQIQELTEAYRIMEYNLPSQSSNPAARDYWEKLYEFTKELDTLEELTGSARYPIRFCDVLAYEMTDRIIEFGHAAVTEAELKEAVECAEQYLAQTEAASTSQQEEIDRIKDSLDTVNKKITNYYHSVSVGSGR